MKERFETFTVLINRISRNVRKIKNQEMAEYNLRSSHISCLYYLYSAERLTATDLCERCEEDKATISRALDYLETNGYLTCESKSAKRYKSPLALTDKGLAVAKKIADKIDGVLDEISAGLYLQKKNWKTVFRKTPVPYLQVAMIQMRGICTVSLKEMAF